MKDLAILGVGAVGVGLGALTYALLKKESLDTPIAVYPSPMPRPEAEEATKIALLLRKQGIPFEERAVSYAGVGRQFILVGKSNAEAAMKTALQARG